MKKLILILLFIPLVFSCDIVKKLDNNKNHLDESNLNGKIKSLKETSYSAIEKFGEPVEDKLDYKNEYFYDKDGFFKEVNFFNDSRELKNKWKYKYNDGNLIESNKYNKDGELEEKWKLKRDNNGNLIESNKYNNDGELVEKWKFIDQKDGNRVEENKYNNDGELEEKWKHKYDDDGNRIESNKYDKDGELEDNYMYKYYKDGNLMELTFYNEDGELDFKIEYKYEEFDDEKNWLKKISYEDGKAFNITKKEIEYYD